LGNSPSSGVLIADVSELTIGSIFIGRSMKSYFIDLPMKMEPIVSSETSAIRTQTPGNHPKRNKLHLEHGESLKNKNINVQPQGQRVNNFITCEREACKDMEHF